MIKLDLKNSAIILFVILTLLSVLLLIRSANRIAPKKHSYYNTFMINTHMTQLDKEGNIHNTFYSPIIKHYPKNNLAIAQKPVVVRYQKGKMPWHIRSDRGVSEGNSSNKITMIGHVKMHQPAGKNNKDTVFKTSKLYWYPNQSIAKTDKPVTIIQPNSVLHAIGMFADLDKQYVKFLSHTRGTYLQIRQ